MKKIVDSAFDEHTVEETKPLPEQKPVAKPKSNNTTIIIVVILVVATIALMIYFNMKNKNGNEQPNA